MKKIKIEPKAITPDQAVLIYGLNLGTLGNLRSQQRGPKFYRKGRRIYYKISEIEEWLFSEPVQTIDSHRRTTR
jgi:hypothetical protein